MRTLTWIIHCSLDGFAATKDGRLDSFPSGEENLQFVGDLCKNADAAVVGRISYTLLNQYWPSAYLLPEASPGTLRYSNWYNEATKLVVSSTLTAQSDNTIVLAADFMQQLQLLKEAKGKDMLIFGSPMLGQALFSAGLTDQLWVFINPVLFGEGIPMFAPSGRPGTLLLKATRQFANGELALHYLVEK